MAAQLTQKDSGYRVWPNGKDAASDLSLQVDGLPGVPGNHWPVPPLCFPLSLLSLLLHPGP